MMEFRLQLLRQLIAIQHKMTFSSKFTKTLNEIQYTQKWSFLAENCLLGLENSLKQPKQGYGQKRLCSPVKNAIIASVNFFEFIFESISSHFRLIEINNSLILQTT